MIDISLVRENPSILDTAMVNRNKEPIANKLLEYDKVYREAITNQQKLLELRNSLTAEFSRAKSKGEDVSDIVARVEKLKQDLNQATIDLNETKQLYEEVLYNIPNIPSSECPIGVDETANVEIRKYGTPPTFNFKPLEHYEIGNNLQMMDFKNASKIAGARFVLLYSKLAKLERALAQFMLDVHTKENGYTEVYVPLILNREAMVGVGQLPKFEEDLFKTTIDSYLIPTAEASLTNIHSNSILLEEELPKRYTAYTPCFRSEAGSAGKDTKGMLRQHQFGKVELVSITTPGQSVAEHERMTECAEGILKKLGLPFRTVVLSTGDMGFSSEKTYDLEVWLPGQNTYREISSCSRCNSFQARRMNTKFKNKETKKNEFVHTLNGSGIAVGRCLIAILENYQQGDGSVSIPDALIPYFGEKLITLG